MQRYDVVILGAGAAGMMCAIEAGRRGRKVLIIDHARAPGEKIRISGGGRCNFTNLHAAPGNFLSANPHFCKSALGRYTQYDFIDLVARSGIAYHEKTLGQLFCDGSSRQIIDMLTGLMRDAGVDLSLGVTFEGVTREDDGFTIRFATGPVRCSALVVATGGKSIPKMGATGLAYRIAEQFGLAVTQTRPALVPLTFDEKLRKRLKPLSGVSVDAAVRCNGAAFNEAMLFTHRGISGPSVLQISSYWREGDEITLSLLPDRDLFSVLRDARGQGGRQTPHTILSAHLPKRLAQIICEGVGAAGRIADMNDALLRRIADAAQDWQIKPTGSEGYRTAEVTLGGVDTAGLNSRTMEAKAVSSLFFIGEAVDVTGWLGGYNFQWAWSSGWAAGQFV
ncbi:NAD(P)/FAD-dependent oxidoreductase [Hoeflea prorocentri]|uniref:NAD(P)/FAD-dependent oxidoreductase n=1 Tax=Hoeflea prorocentri TaxID=1922333 RepID=A0A9X3UJ67_9HYPH|nr:NAD(P)/FAD-dependent oxidoreductase [Hoeflea prorocentri]MCY6382353.1 NAD(P)/FAD-dependent oxidoreductase [Hoeflea prorocentri]MDA5400153.1 NAD(P)/FAD-dependent oxidoreductase [Hoeflea prorocentri]